MSGGYSNQWEETFFCYLEWEKFCAVSLEDPALPAKDDSLSGNLLGKKKNKQ